MSGEIKINLKVSLENGFIKDSFNPGQVSIDQATAGRGGYVQEIGTAEEVLNFGDVATEGLFILRNVDATNFIEYGPESAGSMVAMGKLLPGEWGLTRLKPGVIVRAKADTAPAKLDVRIYEA